MKPGSSIVFTGHAIRQMFARRISKKEVKAVIETGLTIKTYLDDTPLPSRLICGLIDDRIIHVVAADDVHRDACYIITAYEPDPELWERNFTVRKKA